jgi:DNA-binding transcriptional LysR family regulator
MLERHPKVSLDVDLSARFVDLIAENFDVALRPGALPDDATLAGQADRDVQPRACTRRPPTLHGVVRRASRKRSWSTTRCGC